MKTHTVRNGLITGTVLATLAGCQSGSCFRQHQTPNRPPPGVLVAPPPPTPTPIIAPVGGPPVGPPLGAVVAPPGASPTYLPPPPRTGAATDIRNYPPGPLPPSWRYPNDPGMRQAPPANNYAAPNAPGMRQAPPANGYAAPQRSVVQLQAPQAEAGPAMPRVREEESRSAPPSLPPASVPSAPLAASQSPPPPVAATPSAPPAASQSSPPPPAATPTPEPPKGIPQFAMARDQVANGQRPFDDGFTWLKHENYRTILHLRAPGEDDAADKEAATQRGLQFRTLDVSAETLTPAVVDEFAKIVNDRDGLPLFVYDRDGVSAGALWYLYFRTVDKVSDSEARTKASRLGLRNDEDSKKMMVAIQKFLNDQLK